ncbi:Hypothetical predicted protein [Cloeon dipterum]|uniref:BTB domain-containing protein n=1 Tax=Cloeon dipterum TaxID=197152 RepID=A0A8S1DQS2_9INSE|nr:Hypothetical predicted protein [Cloeon dipterum]
MATYMNAPGTHHQRCKVEVGCGYITELRFCSQNILKKACPALCHEIENHHIHESLPIRIHGSPAAFDAAIRFLSDTFQENLHLDEVKAIELLDFAWKYESLELQKAAESLCMQTDFANLDGLGLINYHSSFLTHKLWSGKEDREKKTITSTNLYRFVSMVLLQHLMQQSGFFRTHFKRIFIWMKLKRLSF